MRTMLLAIILLISTILVFPAVSLGELDGVLKPSIIDIVKDRLFVMDTEQVRVFDMKTMELLNSFGKRGEGPGEYKIIPNFPLSLKAFDDFLIVESIDKLSYFSLDGKYIKEKRKLPLLVKISEIGGNYIGRRIIQPPDGSLSTSALKIYDSEFKEIKELYKQPFLQQGAFPNIRLDLGKDFLLYQIADNKIFVEKSDKGFLIDVYDFKGNKLYQIKKDYKKIPITSNDKKAIIKDIEMDPQIQRQLKQFGLKWADFSRNFKFEFPDHYPPIKSMEIEKEKIYITTFKQKDNKVETIILNLKGKVLKTAFIEPTAKEWVMALMLGIRLETIHNGKIYYIQENEDEEWELFVQPIE